MGKVKNASEHVLVYEKPAVNEGRGSNVLFLDGHVEFMALPGFEQTLSATHDRIQSATEQKSQP